MNSKMCPINYTNIENLTLCWKIVLIWLFFGAKWLMNRKLVLGAAVYKIFKLIEIVRFMFQFFARMHHFINHKSIIRYIHHWCITSCSDEWLPCILNNGTSCVYIPTALANRKKNETSTFDRLRCLIRSSFSVSF